jgi:hypothetical protein
MKIKNKKVRDVLHDVIKDLANASKNSYSLVGATRRDIDSARSRINTLLTLIDFEEE